tara:strand:+ start:198 stop:569 length:372 start_codon:yes stop_codon:yes gene_type:complete
MDDKIMDDKIMYIKTMLESNNKNTFISVLHTFIVKYNLEHTVNSNGIFLNLSVINKTVIDEIYTYIVNMTIPSKTYKNVENENDYIKYYIKNKVDEFKIIKDKIPLDNFDKQLIKLSQQHVSI